MPPINTISPRGLQLIRVSEGCKLNAYWDVDAYSIGFGHHSDLITRDTSWTQFQADNQLLQDAQEACAAVARLVRVELTQGRIDALTDFVYEFGSSKFANSALLSTLNLGEFDSVPVQLRLWVHVKNQHGTEQVSSQLTIRREREIMLWETGDWQ